MGVLMKKLLSLVLLTVICMPTLAQAGKLRDNVGCGLGTLLFETVGKPDGGWLLQWIASSTNGSFYSAFSMTTGTVGCKGSISEVVKYEEVEIFIAENMDDFAKDVAMGEGETLNSVAALLQITDTEKFASLLQDNFVVIFPNGDVTADQVVVKIVELNS